jgi:hypothetical protein
VLVAGSKATVEASVVRETLRNESQIIGHGMSLQAHSTTGAPSTLQLRTSLLQHNAVAGLFVHGSEATVEASVVRENMVRGVEVQHDSTTGASSALQLRASLVEQNYATGVLVDGSDATVEATVVRQTQLNAQGLRGRGINAQSNDTTGAPSTLALARSIIEQSHEGGVFIIGSMATIEGCLVRDTLPNGEAEGGSGILVLSGTGPASAIITATRTERSALAAVAAWGAHAALGSSALVCQAFDFDYETYQGNAATLEDLGDNLCGCPEATAACKAVSAGLEPPPPLD